MIERYFITEEILFDMVMADREDHEIAEKLLDLAATGDITLCLCTASIDGALFVLSKYMGDEQAREFLRTTLEAFEVHGLSEAICMEALSVEATRFVDAAVIICAESEHVDGIIVHDPARFEAADIKIIPLNSLQ